MLRSKHTEEQSKKHPKKSKEKSKKSKEKGSTRQKIAHFFSRKKAKENESVISEIDMDSALSTADITNFLQGKSKSEHVKFDNDASYYSSDSMTTRTDRSSSQSSEDEIASGLFHDLFNASTDLIHSGSIRLRRASVNLSKAIRKEKTKSVELSKDQVEKQATQAQSSDPKQKRFSVSGIVHQVTAKVSQPANLDLDLDGSYLSTTPVDSCTNSGTYSIEEQAGDIYGNNLHWSSQDVKLNEKLRQEQKAKLREQETTALINKLEKEARQNEALYAEEQKRLHELFQQQMAAEAARYEKEVPRAISLDAESGDNSSSDQLRVTEAENEKIKQPSRLRTVHRFHQPSQSAVIEEEQAEDSQRLSF